MISKTSFKAVRLHLRAASPNSEAFNLTLTRPCFFLKIHVNEIYDPAQIN